MAIPSGIPATGQVRVEVTNTAVRFPDLGTGNGVIIKANPNNAAAVTIGGLTITNTTDGTGNGFVLSPGETIGYSSSSIGDLYVNGTANDWVTFIGS